MNATHTVLRLRKVEAELAQERERRVRAEHRVAGLQSVNTKLQAMVLRLRAER
jgi:hypothetical protein